MRAHLEWMRALESGWECHSRPQSHLALLAAGDWTRGPTGAQSLAAKRALHLWGRECEGA